MTKVKSQSRKYKLYQLWFEKFMALIVLFNYILVIFNLTYIPLRDFWLQGRVQLFFKFGQWEFNVPPQPAQILPNGLSQFITSYDAFKGIEPYRSTEQYLEIVEDLEQEINLQGLQQPNPKLESILADLRGRSIEMIDTNPFLIANKTGDLERIKNKMRDHIFNNEDASAKKSFEIFWTRDYLLKNDPRKQLKFFHQEISPLIATNYYRPVGENGKPIDNFSLIDFLFFIIFLPEFLVRTWFISSRYSGISWFDAMLWRWYDIFLLIPIWRWLRIIPLIIRLNNSQLIDLKAIQKQASQGFVATIAEDITEVVVVRIINQLQSSVQEGIIQDFLLQQNAKKYIDVNDTNETAEIIKLMLQVIVNQVLPKLQPEAEAFLKFNLDKAMLQTPAYQSLEKLPGVKSLQNQLTQQLASRSYQILCEVLKLLLEEDPKFNQLLEDLISNFSKTVGSELQTQASMENLEVLIIDLLEEIKINYVQRLSEEDVESILDQTRAIRSITE
jgi:hypothetical protein